MRRSVVALAAAAMCCAGLPAMAAQAAGHPSTEQAASKAEPEAKTPEAKPMKSVTHGVVTINGERIPYDATAGTIILKDKEEKPTASIFYVAYTKSGVKDPSTRPVTFLYNGGPGSSTIWLHMGAFGPERVTTANHGHTAPAPYRLVNNGDSLLDATDLVFIDAPSTGFSRVLEKAQGGAGEPKAFYGVDGDGHAFAQFITRYLTEFNRWNSPKYLFGESYGTTRSAVLANDLETEDDVDLNGVILLSQVLNFDISNVDNPETNPGMDLPYELALPTYAATAWYHHKLSDPAMQLPALLTKVEQFAMGDYAQALNAGTTLPAAQKQQIAQQLAQYTGLSAGYWLKADLRVNGGEFEHELLGPSETTGRLDTRFAGPTMDPLAQEAEYDPQAAAISSAYVSLFNQYVRETLDFKPDLTYRPEYYDSVLAHWDYLHAPPGAGRELDQATNVMPDLAVAMKYNPDLKVLLNAGYYDLATPFYAAVYAMQHLQISSALAKNISYAYYDSGHMVYADLPSLKQLHDNVAKFIAATDHQAAH
ncbi:MAG: peptidase S10 [Acidobacteriota bacterium]|nr:peptidase S10 [Acidobacteriota bacterium]